MKCKEITIQNKDSLLITDIENDTRKLVIKWDKQNPVVNEMFSSAIDSFVHRVTIKYTNLEILDVSELENVKFYNIDVRHLREVYLPKGSDNISFEKSTTLRKLSAVGAKIIKVTNCPNFEEIEYGDCLEELCLSGTGIEKMIVPPHIKLVNNAFQNCTSLRSVIIGEGTDIPAKTFEGCVNLREITLPNDLLVLEPLVFSGCRKLRIINGGLSIKQLFPSAFNLCISLERIEFTSFYKYTNLELTDDFWIKKIRPKYYIYTLEKKLNQIRDFTNGLVEKEISNPESYIACHFLHPTEGQTGVLLKYFWEVKRWCVWSLNQKKYLFSNRMERRNFEVGDVIYFNDYCIPEVEIDSQINVYRNISFINLSEVEIVQRKDIDDDNSLTDIIDFFKPLVSFQDYYTKTKQTIEELDISSIIDSYSIEEERIWHVRPGRDDYECFTRVAKSMYDDAYISQLLPQEDYHNVTFGVRPCGYNTEEENEKLRSSAHAEATKIKEDAIKHYSATEHLCTLLKEFIDKRIQLEKSVESNYYVKTAMDFIEYYFIPFRDEIEEDKTLRILCNYSLEDIL